ncbi:MAG: major capsid protein [Agarilytica sp.]
MPGNFDTYKMVQKIEERKAPLPYFLNRFFKDIIEFDTEEIMFDYVLGERRMAPFVSPMVQGKVMRDKGSTMKSFRPAYVKPKHVVEPGKAMKRLPGESLGGSLSPEQRKQLKIVENFVKEDEMIDNRLEWMAIQALKNGAVVVQGEDYPEKTVDFGRDPGLSIALAGVALWSDSGSNPITDLEDTSTAASKAEHGAPLTEVYMDPDSYKAFRSHAIVRDLLDTNIRGSNANISREPQTFGTNEDPILMGRIGVFNIYVDARQYEDETGSMVPYLASGEVLMLSEIVAGASCFGAILDDDVMRAMKSYPKTWVSQDPSARYTMTQSAPLPVPRRTNASALLSVL